MNLPHWHDKKLFKKLFGQLKRHLEVPGMSISLIDGTKTFIKYETMLGITDIPRSASIDAHALLSQGYFLLLDASTDWRTAKNPIVTGPPHLKFYCGVPLVVEKVRIGVLSIFGPFPKQEFSEEECRKLQLLATEVMNTLNTDYDSLVKKNSKTSVPKTQFHNELAELTIQLGRATSKGSKLTVIDRDGSGGPYSQNRLFRFTKFSSPKLDDSKHIDSKEVRNIAYQLGTLKQAAASVSKLIATKYGIDFVYVIEVRIAEPYKVKAQHFPDGQNKIEAENYKYAKEMIKVSSEDYDFMSRVIGSNNSGNAQLFQFEKTLHFKAFVSEFGLQVKRQTRSHKRDKGYGHGTLIPFHRQGSKLLRKHAVGSRHKACDPDEMIDIYLRSGGYLIGLFSTSNKPELSHDQISDIFSTITVIRRLYITT